MPSEITSFPSIVFHITFVLFLWSYYACVVTDPGTIPPDFQAFAESIQLNNSDQLDINSEDFKAIKVSVCSKCNLKRPPRTHHCSVCGRCVLRMDHHCPFIGNCVGLYNHRFFLQFLVYGALSCINLSMSCLGTLQYNGWIDSAQALVGFLAGGAAFLTFFAMGVTHIHLVLTNGTTLESRSGRKYNPFHTKVFKENCQQIFGLKIIGYFMPIRSKHSVNGTVYPVRYRKTCGEVVIDNNFLVF